MAKISLPKIRKLEIAEPKKRGKIEKFTPAKGRKSSASGQRKTKGETYIDEADEDAPEEKEDETGARSGSKWGRGTLSFANAMDAVAENVSTAAEVDAVEAAMREKLWAQNPRQRERLAVAGIYPDGSPKKYIMRRVSDGAPPVKARKILIELVPYSAGGIGGDVSERPTLRAELVPVKG